jgi:1-aminocyclopropane-1-carboxylate deaminase
MMNLARFKRFPLTHLPTPIQPLKRLTEYLDGPEIWIKRDDHTGLAIGGNKTRKLEFLVADALAKQADTLVSVGGIQSNHTRQTAAAAAAAGLRCELVQRRWVDWQDPMYEKTGNILLSRILGATVHIVPGSVTADQGLSEVADRVTQNGGRPYLIPAGASDHPLGGLGYAHCASEIMQQANKLELEFDYIVHATSSGSTQAGLVVGLLAQASGIKVIGIDVKAAHEQTKSVVLKIAQETARTVGLIQDVTPDMIWVEPGYAGPDYGLPTQQTIEAIRLTGRLEGILLDPVYEGKSMSGLIDMVKRGVFDKSDRILFMQLGGTPALHSYYSIFNE